MKSIRETIAKTTFGNSGERLSRDWIERGEDRTETPRFEEPEKVKETPGLAKLIRATVGLKPKIDPAALVMKAEPTEMDKLARKYHHSAAALLDPRIRDKATAQKQFDHSAMAILRSGNPLPATGALIRAGITSAQVKAGLTKRYGPVERSAPTPGPGLVPSPVAQIDAFGMPRVTQGIDPRSAVRRSMGLR